MPIGKGQYYLCQFSWNWRILNSIRCSCCTLHFARMA